MRQDDRAPFVEALDRARRVAFAPGEYVGQESFMTATEILDLARHSGVAPGTRVLDLCCGTAGPGRLITERLACRYLGVDYSPGAIELARQRTAGLDCRFEVRLVPDLPDGRFDAVLLLETLLAFEHKAPLLAAVRDRLAPGGRFGCTLEEGPPLTAAERAAMPDADTVHLVPLDQLTALLADAGLVLDWQREVTAGHLAVAQALHDAYAARADVAAGLVGERAVEELLAAHRLWIDWMASGRVRKFDLVARG